METIVFDKAKYHFNGNFPKDLDNYQGYVHTGFYIGWLILNDLTSDWFNNEYKEAIEQFKKIEITCVKLYEEQLDGVFSSEELNEDGLIFTKDYFDLEKGPYLNDYGVTLVKDLPSIYHVQDTVHNFTRILPIIQLRYHAWKNDPSTLLTIELR